MTTRLAVLVPYLPERQEIRDRVVDAYRSQETRELEIHVDLQTGFTWGAGLNRMAGRYPATSCDYLLFASDDQLPRDGALQAGIDLIRGNPVTIPHATLYEDGAILGREFAQMTDGCVVPWTPVFLLPRSLQERLGPLLDLNWYVDIDYSQRLQEAGWQIMVDTGFTFDHLNPVRSWYTQEVMLEQREVYRQACVAAGRSPYV